MTPRLFRVILPVRELDAARRFYESVLEVEAEQVSAGRVYLDCGGVVLALLDHRADGEDRDVPPHSEIVYIAVDDVEAARARAAAAGGEPGEIRTMPWGETSFYVRDPSANMLCLVAAGTEFTGGRFVE